MDDRMAKQGFLLFYLPFSLQVMLLMPNVQQFCQLQSLLLDRSTTMGGVILLIVLPHLGWFSLQLRKHRVRGPKVGPSAPIDDQISALLDMSNSLLAYLLFLLRLVLMAIPQWYFLERHELMFRGPIFRIILRLQLGPCKLGIPLMLNLFLRYKIFHYNYIDSLSALKIYECGQPPSQMLRHYYGYIIYHQQMSTNDEKENIIALPLAERAVAVALKHVFDQIKLIEEEENKEVQALHSASIGKFKAVEDYVSKIVKGGPIDKELLKEEDISKFFTETEKLQIDELAKNNKGIKDYWATALSNFYGEDLSEQDKQIAASITNISTNVTVDRLEVIFEIAANQWISSGIITKRFVLEGGLINRVQGDNANWLKEKPEGIFKILFSEATSPNELNDAFTFASQFINEIVPYSLQFYLGATEEIDDEGDAEEDQEEEEEDSVPAKKIKE